LNHKSEQLDIIQTNEKIKIDILHKYSQTLTQRQSAIKGVVGPAQATTPSINSSGYSDFSNVSGENEERRSKAQPIYSISLKMTAATRLMYINFVKQINTKQCRIGPGKAFKALLKFQEEEINRRQGYCKNINGYLRQVRDMINNGSQFDKDTKKMSTPLKQSLVNLEYYIKVIGFSREEVRGMLKHTEYADLFELFVAISRY
jgi:hypothetical protein